MPYNTSDYPKRIAGLVGELDRERNRANKAEADKLAAETRLKTAEEEKTNEIANLKKIHDDAEQRIREDLKKTYYLQAKEDVRKDLIKETDTMIGLRANVDGLTKERDKLVKEKKTLENKVTLLSGQLKGVRDEKDDLQTRLSYVAEKTGMDLRAMESASLDAQATKLLREWRKNWEVIRLDKENLAYINLGSADGLERQVTFSVHGVGVDGKRLKEVPKGTMEVVRVVDTHLALARITSIKDAKKDPIVRGDRLFNPTWDPTRRKQVAIAGFTDIGTEGADNNEDLRRLLTCNRVDVVAYIDTKDLKEPAIKGPGISTRTDFLILGDGLEGSNHPKARDKAYAQAFDRKIRELKDKAATNGVTLIPLRRYLDMIGYRAPRVSLPGGSGAYPR